jgi:hypothetical protein
MNWPVHRRYWEPDDVTVVSHSASSRNAILRESADHAVRETAYVAIDASVMAIGS